MTALAKIQHTTKIRVRPLRFGNTIGNQIAGEINTQNDSSSSTGNAGGGQTFTDENGNTISVAPPDPNQIPIQISDDIAPGIPITITPLAVDSSMLVQQPLPDLGDDGETVTVTAQRANGASDTGGGGSTGGNIQYSVIKATTYDPSLSNGETVTVTPGILAAGIAGEGQVAVPQGNAEKLGYIVTNADGTLGVVSASDAQAGSNIVGDTVTDTVPANAVALIHGHIDRDFMDPDSASNGMVDNTASNGGYGDSQALSLTNPIPEGTVSQGQVGWHVIVNGQLEYMYPQGSMTQSQVQAMQSNLNAEQAKFQVQK